MAQSDLDKMTTYVTQDDAGLIALDSPTVRVGPASTSYASSVPIGFDFNFDGVTYSDCTVSALGYIMLAGTPIADNTAIFSSDTNVIIAPWCDVMITAHSGPVGYVATETQGVAPFRRFVVEWLTFGGLVGLRHTLQFQAVLYETKDRIEYRYAPLISVVGAVELSGSRAIKGDTSGDASNYRDQAYQSFGTLMLGGSSTATTTTLTASDYRNSVDRMWVCEPNWPMCGRAFLVDPDMVTGRGLFGSSDVVWRIANFVNWLWCRHTPPLVNISPYEETDRIAVTHVVPVSPSDEGLSYDVYVQVYATAGANCTVSVYEDAAADPQPATGGDWSFIDSDVQAVSGAQWNELTVFSVPIDPATTHLKLVVGISTGNLRLGSILMVPTAMDDIDVSYTSLTGWFPMAIGQIRQDGAPVHPEWFNRAWANIAHILRDRRQMVWSSVWPELSLRSLVSTTGRPVRTIGVSKAWLPVRGARAKARVYARDTSGDAPLLLAEQGNGLLAEWAIDDAGGEYRTQEADVTLLSDEPHISASCDPVGTLSPMSVTVDWSPALSTAPLFAGVTPAPRLALLFALIGRMEFALRCNVATGLATMLARGKTLSNKWRVQTWVGPAVAALRPKVARDSDDQSAESLPTLIYGASSGSGAADEIYIDSPHARGRDDYPPEGAIAFADGAETYDDTPAATMARLLESPTITDMQGGARERIEIVRGVGVVFVPARLSDPLAL